MSESENHIRFRDAVAVVTEALHIHEGEIAGDPDHPRSVAARRILALIGTRCSGLTLAEVSATLGVDVTEADAAHADSRELHGLPSTVVGGATWRVSSCRLASWALSLSRLERERERRDGETT